VLTHAHLNCLQVAVLLEVLEGLVDAHHLVVLDSEDARLLVRLLSVDVHHLEVLDWEDARLLVQPLSVDVLHSVALDLEDARLLVRLLLVDVQMDWVH
jgi:hypothetical protein